MSVDSASIMNKILFTTGDLNLCHTKTGRTLRYKHHSLQSRKAKPKGTLNFTVVPFAIKASGTGQAHFYPMMAKSDSTM
jgi:hypothetical protein